MVQLKIIENICDFYQNLFHGEKESKVWIEWVQERM